LNSENFLNDDFRKESLINIGETLGNQQGELTIETASSHKNVPMILPFGLAALPAIGEKVLILQEDNKTFCLGTIVKNKKLNPGEILISSKSGASIFLNKNGEISLSSVGGAKIVLNKTGQIEFIQKK
jgi:hypothetical protein